MTRRTSDLPFGSEFSPSQINLPELLELAVQFSGNQESLQKAILDRYFSEHGQGSEKNKKKLAMNCRLGMKAYGIIDEKSNVTEFGYRLHDLKDDEFSLYFTLAQHILRNLNGMSLIQCIKDMTSSGESVDLTTLREGLAVRGVHYPRGGKHPSMMRLWLAKAGIFIGSRWQVDEKRLTETLGAETGIYDVLSHLTHEQRCFLSALVNTQVLAPQPANEIAKLAEATYGVKFPEKSLPKLVLNALVSSGFITAAKTTAGRGSKPFMVAPTEQLVEEVISPLIEQLKSQIDPKVLDLLKKPFPEVLSELDSADRYTAGLALEALAFKLMRLLDMKYVATRLRAQATGGAEVDLIFESARLVFSRWQIQCKNTSRVALDDVAKEVGLTFFLKSNVIVIVSTGNVGLEARRYANKIMTDSNLNIVMIDSNDLNTIKGNPSFIVDAFSREARNAMQLKKLPSI